MSVETQDHEMHEMIEVTERLPEADGPVFVTAKLHEQLGAGKHADYNGRLWDVFFMSQNAPTGTEVQVVGPDYDTDTRSYERFFVLMFRRKYTVMWSRCRITAARSRVWTFGFPEEAGPDCEPMIDDMGYASHSYLSKTEAEALLKAAKGKL